MKEGSQLRMKGRKKLRKDIREPRKRNKKVS